MNLGIRLRLSVLGAIAAFGLGAQTPAFEAASIKRNDGVSPNTRIDLSGGRVTMTNATLKTLIRNAYDILSFQLAGGPRWLDSESFDIVATTGSPEKISTEQFRKLLQSLLAERFQLKVHREKRETSVYALVPSKEGPKFQTGDATQEAGINTSKSAGHARMKGTNAPLALLASNLGNQLGGIVEDKTGMPGVYNWLLEWDPDPTAESTLPSLLAALPQQLGVRLETRKGFMDMLVIDTVNHPTAN
ncbi:MAG: TIGR03435 family protein [Candidatus Solibacter sp.]